MQWVVQVEQKIAIAREAICEQHLARPQLVLRVMRPGTFLAHRCRRHDSSVPVAQPVSVPREVDDGEKVAVVAVFVTGPCEEISSRLTLRGAESRRHVPGASKSGGYGDEREWRTVSHGFTADRQLGVCHRRRCGASILPPNEKTGVRVQFSECARLNRVMSGVNKLLSDPNLFGAPRS